MNGLSFYLIGAAACAKVYLDYRKHCREEARAIREEYVNSARKPIDYLRRKELENSVDIQKLERQRLELALKIENMKLDKLLAKNSTASNSKKKLRVLSN